MKNGLRLERNRVPKRDDDNSLWWWEGPPWPGRSREQFWQQVDEDEVPPATPPYEPEQPVQSSY